MEAEKQRSKSWKFHYAIRLLFGTVFIVLAIQSLCYWLAATDLRMQRMWLQSGLMQVGLGVLMFVSTYLQSWAGKESEPPRVTGMSDIPQRSSVKLVVREIVLMLSGALIGAGYCTMAFVHVSEFTSSLVAGVIVGALVGMTLHFALPRK